MCFVNNLEPNNEGAMARFLRPQPRYSVRSTPFGMGMDKTQLILMRGSIIYTITSRQAHVMCEGAIHVMFGWSLKRRRIFIFIFYVNILFLFKYF